MGEEPYLYKNMESSMTKYSLKKRFAFAFILFVLIILFTILCFEIYAHIFRKYDTPSQVKEKSLQYERSLFARHMFPQKEQRVNALWSPRKKEYTELFVNKKGYRGPDFSANKDDETIRIMIFGGSQVFSIYDSEGKDWPHQVENILKNNGFLNVEVINAGTPGHASFDSLGKLFAEGHVFMPDYVIIDNAWNDIKLFRFNEPLLRSRPPSKAPDDPRVNYQGFIDYVLSENSQLYIRLRSRYYNWKYNIDVEGAIPEGDIDNEIHEIGLRQYRLNMEMFVDLARNIGAVPILMTQPRLVALNISEEDKSVIAYDHFKLDHQTLCYAFEKTDEIIRSVAESKNALLIDASEGITGKREYFLDGIHTSAEGSYNLALVTANRLMDILKERNN
jgi:lysophospholipase L1-like esterase